MFDGLARADLGVLDDGAVEVLRLFRLASALHPGRGRAARRDREGDRDHQERAAVNAGLR